MSAFDREDQEVAIATAREVLQRTADLLGTDTDDTMTVTYTLNALLMAAYELALLHNIEPEVLTGAVKKNYAALYAAAQANADGAVH